MNDTAEIGAQSTPQEEAFDSEKVQRLPIRELLKRIGPSIILTGIAVGPGSITTASMIGSEYGYTLVWLFLPIMFMGVSFLLTTHRISLLTGMPTFHAIRHYYGSGAAKFVGIASFLSCMFFTIGNISGCGAGMNLIFGINWKIGATILIAALVYCYFSKGVYNRVEKIIGICIIGMLVAYCVTLGIAGGPDPGQMASGLTHWTFPAGSFATALAFISTSASINAGIYGTYLGQEKKWKKEDLFNGTVLIDAIAQSIGVILISGAIMLVGAIVLHPNGTKITSAVQLAEMLIPLMGQSANVVMGIALLAAAFSALLGNTHRTVVLLNAGFNQPTSLEDKSIKRNAMIVVAIAAVICFTYGKSPVQLIYLANVASAIATPVAGGFICAMIWRKDVNQGAKKPRVLRVCMLISYLFCLILTLSTLGKVLTNFSSSIAALF